MCSDEYEPKYDTNDVDDECRSAKRGPRLEFFLADYPFRPIVRHDQAKHGSDNAEDDVQCLFRAAARVAMASFVVVSVWCCNHIGVVH